MPELPEVEGYRMLAQRRALGRAIASVDAPDLWYLKRGVDPAALGALLTGRSFRAARRRGKLMMLDVGGKRGRPESVLGLRYGMSGRLVVDGEAGVEGLLYTTAEVHPRYERFALRFEDGGYLAMSDPRRLGGVEVDPDEDRLGPDALTLSLPELRRALEGAHVALKARIMDQARVAGVGNLIADEVLWRAGLSPEREAASLSTAELRRLHRHLAGGLKELIERGGSHTGDLQVHRRPGGRCPRDGAELRRATIGGRTSWWCPQHQR